MNVVKYQKSNDTVVFNKTDTASKLLAAKRFVIDEFVHGGHLVSLASSAIALSAMLLLNIGIRWEFLLVSYLGTYCIYSYDHYKGIKIDSSNNSTRTNHLIKYYRFIPFILIIYGIAFFSLLIFFGNTISLFFGGLLLLSSLFYTSKVKNMTKKIVGFKNIYTSFSISLLIVFTVVYCSYPLGWLVFILFAFLFLRLMLDTSFCDIKDMDSDRKLHLLTLPLYFGKQRFLTFLHIINFLSFALIIVSVSLSIVPSYWLFLGIFTIYCFYYIQKVKDPKANFQSLASIAVDGEYLLWPIVLFVGKFFMTIMPIKIL
ncbi:MAG: UbiA family prenyltransferase [Candidatus Thermoplasmatota archaeon]|jgi:4-hydroxybenzoate polyprenyltransferase|nr:UbiA family prenyltransferase [Candidatus Thermoplasmatota archaeon]